ncbi:MAG: VWA domain-containing protein [Gemmataceae bacterium]|nr:VWA domain-containing protein [Gemmataceae bacterium]
MRAWSLVIAVVAFSMAPLLAQVETPYRLDFNAVRDVKILDRDADGTQGLFIQVKFTITVDGDKAEDLTNANYKVVIEEDNRRVREVDLPRPAPSEDLTVILALDTSGSMAEHGRMGLAKTASETFLSRLPTKAECGLILFDHEIRPPTLQPIIDRQPLLGEIRNVQPRGGTAYLDAADKGIQMLGLTRLKLQRHLVLLTDGLDQNSTKSLDEVIAQAKIKGVRVHTVGLGEPGRQEPVSSVLVLDRSGSMQSVADDLDVIPKIEGMRRAATRFVGFLPFHAKTTLIPFGTLVQNAGPFGNEKFRLNDQIKRLEPQGETALFDATHAAIATLDASGLAGRRVVIAMSDGVDNSSRHRVEEVIARAKESQVPLFMLGFGREKEVDQVVMRRMAKETGGEYYHAKNEKDLIQIFENLSIKIHDDGIDEVSLNRLAYETGGKYYPAKNIADLKLVLAQAAAALDRKTYEITFPSLRQVRDGTARNVALKLVKRTGEVVSNAAAGAVQVGGTEQVIEEKKVDYQTTGVVVAEMNHFVYLGLLAGITLLIVLPSMGSRRNNEADRA